MRERAGSFLVEGSNGVTEALAVGRAPDPLFVSEPTPAALLPLVERARAARVAIHGVTPAVMAALSGTETPPGLLGVVPFVDRDPQRLLDGPARLLVVLDQLRDPGNLGTILRTAWAAGVDGVFLGEGCVDVYNPKVVRASAGAIFHVPVARDVAIPWILTQLGSRGIQRVAADPAAAATYDEVDMGGPCALVFGNEAWGLPEEVLAAVDQRASIPMQAAAESVNVGIAAAVFLFEALRQRRHT